MIVSQQKSKEAAGSADSEMQKMISYYIWVFFHKKHVRHQNLNMTFIGGGLKGEWSVSGEML